MKSYLVFGLVIMLYGTCGCKASDCEPNNNPVTITVSSSGQANFSTIQSAINYVPDGNSLWIHILISSGTYREKVTIPVNKTCIFLEGASIQSTVIDWSDSETTDTSATFTSYADNLLVKSVTFKNSYNLGQSSEVKQAVAARIGGDKSAFDRCGFVGVQDTLWDEMNRHYFKHCYIEGAVDFIFGQAQSIYQGCRIGVNVQKFVGRIGAITAQGKGSETEESGFVFKDTVILNGTGQALLGRAWGPYSTVIFYNTFMSDVVLPQGWDAWHYSAQVANLTYVENANKGPGADVSKRVAWEKKLGTAQLNKFLDISFINHDDWLSHLPSNLD